MKNILVAIDFSDVSERLVDKAGELAKSTGAKLWVMHAVSDTSFISGAGEVPVPWTVNDADLPKHFPSEQGKLSELVASVQDRGIDAQSVLVSGPAVDRVIAIAEKVDADMIVVGSHGHTALYKLIVGTISEGLLRRAHRPVLVVPSEMSKEPTITNPENEPTERITTPVY